MLNKKGFSLVEIIIMVAILSLGFALTIENKSKNKENQRSIEQSQKFNEEIEDNRFTIIPHGDHYGKRIRVDTVQDTNTGKSYIIFRGYDGITALEIK